MVGPLSERMKAKCLFCSLFLLRSVMLTLWKARQAGEGEPGRSRPAYVSTLDQAVALRLAKLLDKCWPGQLAGNYVPHSLEQQGVVPLSHFDLGNLARPTMAQGVWLIAGHIGRGQDP